MEQNQILGLNAPYGAWRFLTDSLHVRHPAIKKRLNAPFGARCFLTRTSSTRFRLFRQSLNSPFGARCFLTRNDPVRRAQRDRTVLMHLLALGAF